MDKLTIQEFLGMVRVVDGEVTGENETTRDGEKKKEGKINFGFTN